LRPPHQPSIALRRPGSAFEQSSADIVIREQIDVGFMPVTDVDDPRGL